MINNIKQLLKNTINKKYSEIIARLIKSAKERQLQDLLMDETDTISIDEARRELDKKWPKSK